MAEFCGSEPVYVKPGEPIPLIIKNKCKSSFSVATGIVFHDDGVYTVLVKGNKITVLKEDKRLPVVE
jgi:hypothetical protein